MRSFRNHLKEKLKDERFRRIYKEEKQLAELSLKIYYLREQMGLSQKEVARRATITQQQLSKVENGINCNMTTFLKVCHALDLNIELDTQQISIKPFESEDQEAVQHLVLAGLTEHWRKIAPTLNPEVNSMPDVHYFPRYSQRENFVTNNTLLLFQRLYDYNLRKFGRFLMELDENLESYSGHLGVHITQQTRTGSSVPDGFIIQHPLKIVVETKLHEGFSESQLHRHLDTISKSDIMMLLSLRGEPDENVVASLRDKATIVITSFQEIIGAARTCLSEHDEDMNALVDDYEAFCSESNLLPRDDYTLFVASCGYTIEMNARLRLYYCPSSWNRRKSKYLGIYDNKVVQHIGRINNVVSCDLNQDGTLNIIEGKPNRDEQERIQTAIQEQGLGPGNKFFLCSEMEETYFEKQTKGGVRSVKYVDLGKTLGGDENVPDSLAELAEELQNIPWS